MSGPVDPATAFKGLSEEAWKIVRRLRDRKVISVARPDGLAAVEELRARHLVEAWPDPDRPGVLLVRDHPAVPYVEIEKGPA